MATLADVAASWPASRRRPPRARLNGHARAFARQRRAAVEDAAARLTSSPRRSPGRCARSRRSRSASSSPMSSSPFYAAALKGAQGRLEQAGYRVMLHGRESGRPTRELAALRDACSHHRSTGLLVASAGIGRARALTSARFRRRDTVRSSSTASSRDAGDGAVTLDNDARDRLCSWSTCSSTGTSGSACSQARSGRRAGAERLQALRRGDAQRTA